METYLLTSAGHELEVGTADRKDRTGLDGDPFVHLTLSEKSSIRASQVVQPKTIVLSRNARVVMGHSGIDRQDEIVVLSPPDGQDRRVGAPLKAVHRAPDNLHPQRSEFGRQAIEHGSGMLTEENRVGLSAIVRIHGIVHTGLVLSPDTLTGGASVSSITERIRSPTAAR